MKQIEIKKDNNNEVVLDFHDALVGNEVFYFIQTKLKDWKLYVIIINLYFAFHFFVKLYKQIYDTLWKNFLDNYIKYWLLIYLLPAFAFGIVLPGALTSVIPSTHIGILMWELWIGIGTCTFVFFTPYSILFALFHFRKKMINKFAKKLSKVKITQ